MQMMQATTSVTPTELPFELLDPGMGVGRPAPPGWQPIAAQPLLILVGLLGVGKTTTVATLSQAGLVFRALPERRALAGMVITQMQVADGEPVRTVDRIERLSYTRRYRERFPGGIAHLLAQASVAPAQPLLLFDGLRGEDEVSFAVEALPRARFVAMDAPDVLRLARMLTRNDPFDWVKRAATDGQASVAPEALDSFAALGVAEASDLFSRTEEHALLALVHSGAVAAADLRDKLTIVVEERRNYDPAKAIAALTALAPERTFVIETSSYTPLQVARAIIAGVKKAD
jgi:hypothetical protein